MPADLDLIPLVGLETAGSHDHHHDINRISRPASRASTVSLDRSAVDTRAHNLRRARPLEDSWSPSDHNRLLVELRNPVDPTRYTVPCSKPVHGDAATVREYRRRWQRTRILLNSSSRLVLTAVLCSLCALVLRSFQKKGALSPNDISWFQTYMTALPLVIALNFRSSLQSYVKILRWWILSTWHWHLRHFDLILNSASSQAVLKLMWHSRSHRRRVAAILTQLACIVWMLINVIGAVGLALLSLTYNVDQTDAVLYRSGSISVLDINSNLFLDNAQAYAATSAYTNINSPPNVRREFPGLQSMPHTKECNATGGNACRSWRYTFRDQQPGSSLISNSTRSIVSQVTCQGGFAASQSDNGWLYSQDGSHPLFPSDVHPALDPASYSTSYHYNAVALNATESDRPPKIIVINSYVFQKDPKRPKETGALDGTTMFVAYLCNSDFFATRSSQTSGISETDFVRISELSDASAAQLGRAIAVTHEGIGRMRTVGYQSNADAWSASYKKSEHESATAEEVADTISRFQMTALAVGDQGLEYMPQNLTSIADLRTTVAGKEPYNAFGLKIQWSYTIGILCGVPALQLTILLLVVVFANDTIVKDDSYLCTARLLEPVIEKLGKSGSLLTVDEVVNLLGSKLVRLQYGWEIKERTMRVTVLTENPTSGVSIRERGFPEGKYD